MSNIAGKSYAMNVITPVPKYWVTWRNKVVFWAVQNLKLKYIQNRLNGLVTLSLIHYARWVIISEDQFPHLSPEQPREKLKYNYMLFFSNFNGSWSQYVDSFSMAIPNGLDLFWHKNVLYPNSVPMQPFHEYITFNQIWTNHYYNAYPTAASNDVKAGKKVMSSLQALTRDSQQDSAEEFKQKFNRTLLSLQHSLGQIEQTPIVSLSAEAVEQRQKNQ